MDSTTLPLVALVATVRVLLLVVLAVIPKVLLMVGTTATKEVVLWVRPTIQALILKLDKGKAIVFMVVACIVEAAVTHPVGIVVPTEEVEATSQVKVVVSTVVVVKATQIVVLVSQRQVEIRCTILVAVMDKPAPQVAVQQSVNNSLFNRTQCLRHRGDGRKI